MRRTVVSGSSPRGRGKRSLSLSPEEAARLIPARAGKTQADPRSRCHRPAHPRAGGENVHSWLSPDAYAGSSPRGRGKRAFARPTIRVHGLIPARAGKTASTASLSTSQPAHPRAGGENENDHLSDGKWSGSSPRGRGKRQQDRDREAAARLIPARAGKTHIAKLVFIDHSAHPRAGGENKLAMNVSHSSQGSSPRGRGKRIRPSVG